MAIVQAVAQVECDTQQRRDSQQLQWEAKQQEMDQKLELAEAGPSGLAKGENTGLMKMRNHDAWWMLMG